MATPGGAHPSYMHWKREGRVSPGENCNDSAPRSVGTESVQAATTAVVYHGARLRAKTAEHKTLSSGGHGSLHRVSAGTDRTCSGLLEGRLTRQGDGS